MRKKEVFKGNKNHYLIFEMLSLGKISKKKRTQALKEVHLKVLGAFPKTGVWNYLNFHQRCCNENHTGSQNENKNET